MVKIQQVHIERFKVLENLEVELKGKNVLLIGDNGLGKSSFMQFVKVALGEQKHLPPDTEGKGFVIATKDGLEYAFSVEIKDGKSKVVITGPDNLKDNRKGTLAQIVGAMDFDVNEFVELSRTKAGQKKQVEIYRSFLEEEIQQELRRLETNVNIAFEERSNLNRDIAKLDGAIKQHPLNPHAYANQLDKFKPIDISSVFEQQKHAQAHNEMVEKALTKKEQNDKEVERVAADIQKKEEELKKMKIELNLAEGAQTKTNTWLSKNPKQDTSSFDESINSASETNKQYEQAQALKKMMKDFHTMGDESGELTAKIGSQREAIAEFVRRETPVDGLVFDEEKLLYKDMPVHPDSMATSEIIELGIRMKMAENPDLGVLFIEHGESLGKEKFQALMDISKTYGWQLLIEQVERGTDTLKIELISEDSK